MKSDKHWYLWIREKKTPVQLSGNCAALGHCTLDLKLRETRVECNSVPLLTSVPQYLSQKSGLLVSLRVPDLWVPSGHLNPAYTLGRSSTLLPAWWPGKVQEEHPDPPCCQRQAESMEAAGTLAWWPGLNNCRAADLNISERSGLVVPRSHMTRQCPSAGRGGGREFRWRSVCGGRAGFVKSVTKSLKGTMALDPKGLCTSWTVQQQNDSPFPILGALQQYWYKPGGTLPGQGTSTG